MQPNLLRRPKAIKIHIQSQITQIRNQSPAFDPRFRQLKTVMVVDFQLLLVDGITDPVETVPGGAVFGAGGDGVMPVGGVGAGVDGEVVGWQVGFDDAGEEAGVD